MAEGFRFDGRPANTPQQLAQKAVDVGRILFPIRCQCGKEVLANIKAFRDPQILVDTLKEDLHWGVVTTYVPQIDHVAIRPLCQTCYADFQKDK